MIVGDEVIVGMDSSSPDDESKSFLYKGEVEVGCEKDFQISAEEVAFLRLFA